MLMCATMLPTTGIEREQAIADISRSALCCHSNKTHALITNLPNSAHTTRWQAYHSPKLHAGPCSSVGIWRGTDRQTGGRDQHTFRHCYASREM